MTKRLLPPIFLAAAAVASLTGCPQQAPDPTEGRLPFVDDWETVANLPAAQFVKLSIGDRLAMDNFSNRGNVDVIYDAAAASITVEMQRFTVQSSQEAADEAFGRMSYWGYDISSPEAPSDDNAVDVCENPEVDTCYIRAYYDGMIQPLRDGVNFRVTIPAGWPGNLDIVTSDNLEEGIETYPDRSDVTVDGVNGNLNIDLDSGNVTVRMDPNIAHYAGCSSSQACEDAGYAMGCGCSEPTNVTISNKNGQASNITVDVGESNNWYTMLLENRGTFSSGDEFVCNATIDCGAFADCVIDPAYSTQAWQERAEVNYPGDPAIQGAGIRIQLISEDCANIDYVDGPEDYDAETLPSEKRGELNVCVGCL